MPPASSTAPRSAGFTGRCFVGPVFDYLWIGAGASLPVLALVLFGRGLPGIGPLADGMARLADPALLPFVVLIFSSTHFAASTVRLYTKPGAVASLPFVTLVLPVCFLALLSFCVLVSPTLGRHLQALYLTWSPYHYAAQAYGLAVMYCYRSGCAIDGRNKKLLRALALAPFAAVFLTMPGIGLSWLLPASWLSAAPVHGALAAVGPALAVVSLAGPLALFAAYARRAAPMPAIAPLLLVVNAVWWLALPPLQAFLWATFFHGIQYLAIVVIFHLRERESRAGRRGALGEAALFYAGCLALGYALFNCLPQAYVFAGASTTESLLLVIAAVNIHHFVVDGFIWKLGRRDANRAVVDAGAALAPAA
jgi:hypothetical protein